MDNNLQFILSLKDVLSPAMLKAGGVSDEVAIRIQNDLKKITGSADALGKNDFGNKIANQLNNAKRSAGELNTNLDATKSKFDMLGEGAMNWVAGLGLAAGAINLIKNSLTAAADYEQQRISFGVMTGSQEKGDSLLGGLKNYANVTPYEFTNVSQSAQTLLQFGMAQEKILPTEKELGDIAAGNAEKLQSLSLAYAQVQSAGRLQGQDLLQLINSGFNPLLEISKMTGISMADLKKKMEQGAISADMVAKAFEHVTGPGGQFYQMTEKQSQTLAGKWSTLMDAGHEKILALGNAFVPAAHKGLDFLLALAGGTKSVAESVKEETDKIYGLYGQLTAVNTSEAERKKLLEQLKELNPKITEGIDAQSISYSRLAGNIASVTSALNQQKIAQQFRDENADMFAKYGRATTKQGDASLGINVAMSKAFSMYPDIAANTSMSYGQKQIALMQRLQADVKSGKAHEYSVSTTGSGMGYGGQTYTSSTEADVLMQMQGGIKTWKKAKDAIEKISPEYNRVSKEIKTATDLANKGLGVTDATKTNASSTISPTDFNALTTSGKSKADAINSGGQRSVIINIAKQTGIETIYVGSGKEAVGEIESGINEAMRKLVYSLNGASNT